MATHNGNAEIVKLLIGKNVQVNTKNNKGETPLHVSAFNGYIEIVKLLIKYCQDNNCYDSIHIKNGAGQIAQEVAESKNYHIIANMLEPYANITSIQKR